MNKGRELEAGLSLEITREMIAWSVRLTMMNSV